MDLKFDLPKIESSIIKVLGVGGGGSNAVNHMYDQGIKGVDFIICNTDRQALEQSPIPNKMQIGGNMTEGRGAGSSPEIGKKAALENIDEIKKALDTDTKMLFITAGMGGGTGTGATPIIAQAAKEMGILTVGIVTTPFKFEGPKRGKRANEGLEQLGKNVDTLLVISNEKLKGMFGNLTLSTAFCSADNILTTAAKGIAEIITVPGYINVDFEDVKTVMANSGGAIMGSATAEGEGRDKKAVEEALHSPLLSENEIKGAKYILLNITSGQQEVLMDEITTITDYIHEAAGNEVDMIWGTCVDENLGEELSVTIIATAFDQNPGETLTKETDHEEQEPTEQKDQVDFITRKESPKEHKEGTTEPSNSGQMTFEFDHSRESSNHQEGVETTQFEAKQNEYETKNGKQESQQPLFENSPKSKSFSSEELEKLENEPAYVRKQIKFMDVPHSSETEISKLTLGEEDKKGKENNKPEIKENNSFLNNNVD